MVQLKPEARQIGAVSPQIVNDFALTVATANGTGSQTSNLVLLHTLFNIGIPVTGKNLFPSNIQGMPTWYTIRLSKDGYGSRREGHEILVCMNPATAAADMAEMEAGGIVVHDAAITPAAIKEGVVYHALPIKELLKPFNVPIALRSYVGNMAYVGALAWLIELPLAEIEKSLSGQLKGKEKAIQLNLGIIEAAYAYCRTHYEHTCPYRAAAMTGHNEGRILIDGNTAAALGGVFGGVNLVSWYPITPSSSLAEALAVALPRYRLDPDTGQPTFAVVQAEDEIAAVGMAIGAGWAGARGMTATSGPGISLMSEFVGLAYFAEIPVVVWDIQRMGPSTGLPTRTSQGDVLSAYTLGHGDTRHVVLFPGSPKECFEFGYVAFDLAERFQIPVFVLSDLDLGMNLWISDPFEYPDRELERGKTLHRDEVEALAAAWGRYKDVDGDGVGYRTLPGTASRWAGYFTRGTGHDEHSRYSEDPAVWERNLDRISRKFDAARDEVPGPVVDTVPGADIGLISMGSNDPAVQEARDRLQAEGFVTDYLRIRALPVNGQIEEFVARHAVNIVIENNADGQLHSILSLETGSFSPRLVSASRCNGLPLTARWITSEVAGIASR